MKKTIVLFLLVIFVGGCADAWWNPVTGDYLLDEDKQQLSAEEQAEIEKTHKPMAIITEEGADTTVQIIAAVSPWLNATPYGAVATSIILAIIGTLRAVKPQINAGKEHRVAINRFFNKSNSAASQVLRDELATAHSTTTDKIVKKEGY